MEMRDRPILPKAVSCRSAWGRHPSQLDCNAARTQDHPSLPSPSAEKLPWPRAISETYGSSSNLIAHQLQLLLATAICHRSLAHQHSSAMLMRRSTILPQLLSSDPLSRLRSVEGSGYHESKSPDPARQ